MYIARIYLGQFMSIWIVQDLVYGYIDISRTTGKLSSSLIPGCMDNIKPSVLPSVQCTSQCNNIGSQIAVDLPFVWKLPEVQ